MRRPRGGRMEYVSLGRGGPDVSAVGLGMWQAGGKAWGSDVRDAECREAMEAAEALHRTGQIPSIGVSNCAVRDLTESRSHLSRSDIASNQVRYNMLQRDVEAEVVPYCKREGIAVLAWSPIGKGVLTGKYHDGKRPKDRVRAEEDLFKPANLRATAPLIRELR